MASSAATGNASAAGLPKWRWAYVGSRTGDDAQGEGISIYRMDMSTGEWTPAEVVGGLVNPSFLALDRSGRYLYAVHGHKTGVTAFRIDRKTGKLAQIGFQPTDRNPVHLAPDASNRYLVVANVRGGNLSVLPIHADGTLGPVSHSVMAEAAGAREERPRSRPHHCPSDRSGRYVVVPDKGLDRIYVYRFDAATGKLLANDPGYAAAPPGGGPRHVDFHPSGAWAYVINELGSSVTAYRFDTRRGALTMLQTLSTLPPDFSGKNTGAEIWVSHDGNYVYASNRGHDSLAIYQVEPSSGMLALKGWEPTQGKGPRYFGLDPSGRFLYAANENGHTVVSFRVDQSSGKLTPTGQTVKVGSPVCIAFADCEI